MEAINISNEVFSELIEEETPVLVDFWAPWCSYCCRISPSYDKIAQHYSKRLIVAKVNLDEEIQLAHQEQIEIIPTLVLYRNGQAIGSIVAPESRAMIDSFLEESLGN